MLLTEKLKKQPGFWELVLERFIAETKRPIKLKNIFESRIFLKLRMKSHARDYGAQALACIIGRMLQPANDLKLIALVNNFDRTMSSRTDCS